MAGGPAIDGLDDADAGVLQLVERLAATGSDRGTALAREQIRGTIAAGATPPGLRRLAEALAASPPEVDGRLAQLPPPRSPLDAPAPVPGPVPLVEAMRGTALAVLDSTDPAVVAAAVAALVDDGRRVVVTSPDPAALGAVRPALPAGALDRALDRIPALTPPDLRELRRLLTTAPPVRRARADQALPAAGALPAV